MRYMLAILLGGTAALLATLTISARIALWTTSQLTFESPDQVSNVHDAVWIGVNLAALLVGWTIGWSIGAQFEAKDDPG